MNPSPAASRLPCRNLVRRQVPPPRLSGFSDRVHFNRIVDRQDHASGLKLPSRSILPLPFPSAAVPLSPLMPLDADLQRVASGLGLTSYRRHIFLCADQTAPKCA